MKNFEGEAKQYNIEFPSIESVAWGDSQKYKLNSISSMRRKANQWKLKLLPVIPPTPYTSP